MRARGDGRPIDLTPGGQLRDYSYVGDIVSALIAMLQRADLPNGLVLNLCSGQGVSLKEFGESIARACLRSPVLNWGKLPYRPDEMMVVIGDATRANKLLGWKTSTSLEEGMRLTADYERLRPELPA
jgi:nucleoside-diphosphate-sugar epimerase